LTQITPVHGVDDESMSKRPGALGLPGGIEFAQTSDVDLFVDRMMRMQGVSHVSRLTPGLVEA
jgi:hypothetical protein